MAEEVFPWLESLPLAPEYHPNISEFQDPISYIFKIEQEASRYGICKIVPPVRASCKKRIIDNLNRSLSSQNQNSLPKFTTRQQQIGYNLRKHQRPVQRSVWQSGVNYTLPQFELKAKKFAKNELTKGSVLEIETLYWKAQCGRPFAVEYANDMVGSAFDEPGGGSDVMTVGESEWNTRRVARADGSLLKFMKEEIPGVTSAMIYIGMLYSWFAWHVEDNDLHSLNYMHMGAAKTWYGVPMDAAFAFEEVISTEGYGGELSLIETFATLGEKTTIVSPEVLVKAGVPCCRLVQNAGEFVVTFPRAYHSGFSHGFNCAEAVNMATPGWLRVAREATIRRVSINSAPMLSESQLLYDLAMSLCSSEQKSSRPESQSFRIRERMEYERDALVKRTFMQDVMHNNELLDSLGNGSPIILLTEDVLKKLVVHGINLNFDNVVDRRPKKRLYSSYGQPNNKPDPASIFSCVTCGSPCYSCLAIVQPSETAARYLMSNKDVNLTEPRSSSGKLPKNSSTSRERKDITALELLALAYGDSSDSEEGLESNKFVMESNRCLGTFEYTIKVPSTNRKPSLVVNGPMVSACERDSSRMHVFCLEHAREVDQRLRPVGGVNMLLLCHQDYREINDAARLVSKEFGISDDMWTNLGYIDISEQDKTMIQRALDDEETTTGNQDWAVKLGIDIFYNAKLGVSPLYKKQTPRQHSPFNDQIVVAVRDDYKQQEEEHETVSEKQLEVRKSIRKRKRTEKGKFLEIEAQEFVMDFGDDCDYNPTRSSKRKLEVGIKSKPKKNPNLAKIATSDDEEGAFGCDIDGCEMSFKSKQDLETHKQNICLVAGCGKQFFSHKYILQHRRVHMADRPLKCLWKGCKMMFKWVWARTEHIRVHTGARPYVCVEDGCGKTFRFVSDFSRHRRKTGHVKKVVERE